MQEVIIAIFFLGAVIYLINIVRKNFSSKKDGCAKGCGCAIDPKSKTQTKPSDLVDTPL